MLRKATGRMHRPRRRPGRRALPAGTTAPAAVWERARREATAVARETVAVLRSGGVDAALCALATMCVAALVIVVTVYARPGLDPVIGYVTDVDREPDVVTVHDMPPVGPWTSTRPGAAHVTIDSTIGGLPWTVVMPGPEAAQCHGGQPWRLVTGCG